MLKEVIGKGATIEEAQKAALEELSAPEDADIKIEVLELPVKKKFGLFGGSLAKVKVSYEEEEAKPVQAEKAEKKAEVKEEKKSAEAVCEKNAKAVSYDDALPAVKKAYDYLLNIIKGMGISGPCIEISELDGENYLTISCDDEYSVVIGRRGETLDAIQYLVRLVANRGRADDEEYVRVSVNIGNYRQKRENTLKEIARKNANRAIKYNRNVSLEPMNPFERRIVHTVIAEMDGVTSHSVGMDADRRVIITPEGGGRPYRSNNRYSNGKYNNGRYNNRDRGRSNYRDSRSGYDRPSQAPAREPKSDAEGTSLYGKIK